MSASASYLDTLPKIPITFELRWAEDMLQDEFFPVQLVEGLFESRCTAAIFGPPNSGKSTLAVDLAVSVAVGQKWHGRDVNIGLVFIVAAEAPESIRRRIRAKVRHDELEKQKLPLAVIEGAIGFRKDNVDRLISTVLEQERKGEIKCRLLVIDTLAANEPGPEDAEHFGLVISAMNRLRDEIQCCVLIVHHSGKMVEAGLRGHSSLHGALDTVVEVSVREGIHQATVKKQRDGLVGEGVAFSLDPVGVGFRESGSGRSDKLVTACIVKCEGGVEKPLVRAKRGHQATAMAALEADRKKTGNSWWELREAKELFRSHHAQLSPGVTLSRNAPRTTFDGLIQKGLLQNDDRDRIGFPESTLG